MNRRNRMLIVLLVAVLLASGASYLVYRAIREMPVREVPVASVQVAVAAEDLPVGTLLMKEHVKMVGWPAAAPLKGAFASPEDVLNRGLIEPVAMNEPITESKLAPIEAGGGLPATITPGMRALSVRVNQVIGVAGFVVAGTRVDVLVTLNDKADATITRAVVSNVQVLSADQRYDTEQARQGNATPSSVVTLLVTPEDAERITLAQSVGSLMLSLRNPLDTAPTDTKGARVVNLLGAPPPPPVIRRTGGRPRAEPAPKPAEPAQTTVVTIRAGKKSTQVIGVGGVENEK